jgi:hypothetical protein
MERVCDYRGIDEPFSLIKFLIHLSLFGPGISFLNDSWPTFHFPVSNQESLEKKNIFQWEVVFSKDVVLPEEVGRSFFSKQPSDGKGH